MIGGQTVPNDFSGKDGETNVGRIYRRDKSVGPAVERSAATTTCQLGGLAEETAELRKRRTSIVCRLVQALARGR